MKIKVLIATAVGLFFLSSNVAFAENFKEHFEEFKQRFEKFRHHLSDDMKDDAQKVGDFIKRVEGKMSNKAKEIEGKFQKKDENDVKMSDKVAH